MKPQIIMDSEDAYAADIAHLKRANNLLRKALENAMWHWDSKNDEFYCAGCKHGRGRGHSSTCLISHALEDK